jgi:plastocyanin
MRRAFVVVAAASVMGLAALPANAATDVSIQNYLFAPTPVTIAQGGAVQWTNDATSTFHTSTGDAPLALWTTGSLAAGASGSFTFQAAGVYPYHCQIHPSMHGKIRVPILIAPSSGTTATTFTVTLAAASQAGYTFDVQKKHDAGAWKVWKSGVSTLTVTFKPRGTGTFRFRSHLHRTSNGATSGWSPKKAITVS